MKISTILLCLLLLSFQSQGQSVYKIDSLKTLLQNTKADTTQIQLFHLLSQQYILNGYFHLALQTNEKLIALSKKTKYIKGESFYYQNLSFFHQKNELGFYYHWKAIKILQNLKLFSEAQRVWDGYRNYSSSQEYKKRAIDSLEQCLPSYSENKVISAEIYKVLTYLYIQRNQYDKALICQQQAFELYKKNNNQQGTISALLNGITVLEKLNQNQKALEYSLKLTEIENSIKDTDDLGICFHLIGHFYYRVQNRYALSIEYFLKAVEATNNKDFVLESLDLFNIGLLYRNQDYHTKATEYFLKTKDIAENNTKECMIHIAEIYNALGFSLISENKLKEAMSYHLKASQIAEKDKDKLLLAQSLDGIGQIYLKQEKYKEALEYLFRSLKYSEDVNNQILNSYIYLYIAECHRGMKKEKESLTYALKSYDFAMKANWGIVKIKSSLLISELYGDLSQFEDAYLYQKKHLAFKDSILNRDNANHLADIEVKIALQKTKQAIKLLEMDKQIQTEENKNQRLILGSVLGILAILGLLAFVLYRNNHAKIKANMKLLAQKQEIETQATKLSQVNATKDKLFAIIGHDLRSPLNSLKGLLSLLENRNISPEEFILFSGKLKSGVEHVHFTLNNLLVWANNQMQGIEARPQKIEINALVKENFNFLEEIAKNKNITLKNELPEVVQVWADEQLINLVFRNLISNALKFTSKGGEVSVHTKENSDSWEIAIQDTGIGMSSETLSKLFKQEVHITTHGTIGEKGTGLGLLLCKEMIEKNKGKIWAESNEGVGSTFRFVLFKDAF
ncbi:MAG: tetratricopeptide repeat-containing sensor histidine kinase [Raineya sp.]|jgi:signal transduction histidine kinase|nr:tetratricopeptide repeat-containing sensor histidine kinase [Raineya sp.]